MLFIVEDNCFEGGEGTIPLIGLAQIVNAGRHRLIVAEEGAEHYAVWRERQSAEVLEAWDLAVDVSIENEAREPVVHHVRVRKVLPAEPPEAALALSVEEAFATARAPFLIFLENDDADRRFLLSFCEDDHLRLISELEERGYLRFEHCGGIGEMPRRIARHCSNQTLAHRNAFALFDSDARRPNFPSAQSELVRRRCLELSVEAHQLERRAIENYLPKSALRHWTFAYGRGPRTRRQPVFDAFCCLTAAQARHFNMKDGLDGDRAASQADKELFHELPVQVKRSLRVGFGRDVSSLYSEAGLVSTQTLRKDDSWSELSPVVTRLMALVR